MEGSRTAEPTTSQSDAGGVVRFGGWLFRHRSAIPVPVALALLLVPPSSPPRWGFSAIGLVTLMGGELLRLWAVRHIGAISRTRTDRLGPLIPSGPFALVRNPLYIGNILLWIGFALSAQLPWMAAVIAVVLGCEYHAIVRWEERLLESQLGDRYRAYAASVSRWIPRPGRRSAQGTPVTLFSWRETLFSERGTLIAIAVGLMLLGAKLKIN